MPLGVKEEKLWVEILKSKYVISYRVKLYLFEKKVVIIENQLKKKAHWLHCIQHMQQKQYSS